MNKRPASPGNAEKQTKYASPTEVEAAIDSLTPAELNRLKVFARWRIRGLGRKARGRSPHGLLQEALTSALEEDGRKWNPSKVGFCDFLLGAMRSISSNWGAKFDRDEQQQAAGADAKLQEVSLEYLKEDALPLSIHSTFPDPEHILLAKEEVEAVERIVELRERAALIVEAMKSEMSGPEIQEWLGITRTEYETEMKWIRYNVRKFLPRKN